MEKSFEQFKHAVSKPDAFSGDDVLDSTAAEKLGGVLTKDDLCADGRAVKLTKTSPATTWTPYAPTVERRPFKVMSVESGYNSSQLEKFRKQVFKPGSNFFYDQNRIKSVDVLCHELQAVLVQAGMSEDSARRLFSGELAPLIKQLSTYEQVAMPRPDQAQEEMKLRTRLLATVTARFHKEVGSVSPLPKEVATEVMPKARHVPIRSVELGTAKTIESENEQLLKKADGVLQSIVAQVPMYREALAYGTPLEGEHAAVRRVALVAVNNILIRGGQLKQKIQLLQSGFADVRLKNGIEKDITFITTQEQVAMRAATEIDTILKSKVVTEPAPEEVVVPERTAVNPLEDEIKALLATVSDSDLRSPEVSVVAESPQVEDDVSAAVLVGAVSDAVKGNNNGDIVAGEGGEAGTIDIQTMATESFAPTGKREKMSGTFVGGLDARMKQAGQQIADFNAKLEAFKSQATPAFIEALPAYQSIMRNMRTAEPLISGDWPEEDSVKDLIVQDKLQKIASNFALIEKLVTERRAGFESQFGEEMASLRDGMDEALLTNAQPEKQKKAGWWNKMSLVEEGVLAENATTEQPAAPRSADSFVASMTPVETPLQPAQDLREAALVSDAPTTPDALGGYVMPNEAVLNAAQDWRTVESVASETQSGTTPKSHLEDLTRKAESIEATLAARLSETPYTSMGDVQDEDVARLASLRNSLKGLGARMRAMAFLPDGELQAEEVSALAMQIGEIEYGMKQSGVAVPPEAEAVVLPNFVLGEAVRAELRDGRQVAAEVERLLDDGQVAVSWLEGSNRVFQVVPRTAVSKAADAAPEDVSPVVRNTTEEGIERNFSDKTINLGANTLVEAQREYDAAIAAEGDAMRLPNAITTPIADVVSELQDKYGAVVEGNKTTTVLPDGTLTTYDVLPESGAATTEATPALAEGLSEVASKDEIDRLFADAGFGPEKAISAFEQRNRAPLARFPALAEKNNDQGSKRWYRRIGIASALAAALGIGAGIAKKAYDTRSAADSYTTSATETGSTNEGVRIIEEAWPTGDVVDDEVATEIVDETAAEVVAETAPALVDYIVEANAKKADNLWNIAEGDIEGLSPLPALEGLSELNKTILLSNMETALRFSERDMDAIGLTKIAGAKRDPKTIYPGEVVKRQALNDLLEQIKTSLKIS